jgi:stage II sporulation protein D
VTERDASGRVKKIAFRAAGRDYVLSGDTFYLRWGRTRGWNRLKSTKFDVSVHDDTLTFAGRGLGHGVGLCQWGACGRARAGFGYKEILAHYFPGAEVVLRLPGPPPTR